MEPRALLTTWTVNTTADVVEADGLTSLREALSAANTNAAAPDAAAGGNGTDVIHFDPAVAGGRIDLTDSLFVSDTVVVQGDGVALDAFSAGGSALRIDLAAGETAVFNNTIVQRGTAAEGGGIHFTGSDGSAQLLLGSGTQINGNIATGAGGGAAFVSGGTMIFHQGVAADNFTVGPDARGGGVLVTNGGVLGLDHAALNGNRTTGHGGGVAMDAGYVNAGGAHLLGNAAGHNPTGTEPTNGGGLWMNAGTSGQITDSLFRSNTAARDGGGLAVAAGATATVTGTTFDANSATWNGGGVANRGTLDITDGTLSNNTAGAGGAGGSGGGIFTGSGGSTNASGNGSSGNSPDGDGNCEHTWQPHYDRTEHSEEVEDVSYSVKRGESFTAFGSASFFDHRSVIHNDLAYHLHPGAYGQDRAYAQLVEGPEHDEGFEFRSDGSFDYTASADHLVTDTFTYRVVTHCGPTEPATATIHYYNYAPTLGPGPFGGPVDSYTTFNTSTLSVEADEDERHGLLHHAYDTEGDELKVVTDPVTPPEHGSIQLQTDGSFTYTPHNAEYVGTDSFEYKVVDEYGAESDEATVSIDVAGAAMISGAYGNVTDKTIDVWVGEGMTLGIGLTGLIDPKSIEFVEAAWSIGGSVLQDWTPDTLAGPTVDELEPSERTGAFVKFYWWKPGAMDGGPHDVSFTATYQGINGEEEQVVSAEATFDVGGPTYNEFLVRQGVVQINPNVPGGRAEMGLMKTGTMRYGIQIDAGEPSGTKGSSSPNPLTGHSQYWNQVFLSNAIERRTFTNIHERFDLSAVETDERADGQPNQGKPAVDLRYKYTVLESNPNLLGDNPAIWVDGSVGITGLADDDVAYVWRLDSFRSTLIYTPQFKLSSGHAVPVIAVDWGWGGRMTRPSSNAAFSLDWATKVPPTRTDWPDYPDWVGRIQTYWQDPENYQQSSHPGF